MQDAEVESRDDHLPETTMIEPKMEMPDDVNLEQKECIEPAMGLPVDVNLDKTNLTKCVDVLQTFHNGATVTGEGKKYVQVFEDRFLQK